MPQISSRSFSLLITLAISIYTIFTPLEAFLDHFLDFHLSEEAKPEPKQEGYEKDGVWVEHEALYDYFTQDRDRSSSPGDDGGRDFSPDRDQ